MNVILCEDVDNLGLMGEQVNVKPGYARNYLLPRRLAVVADSASAKQIEHEMRIIKKREEKRRVELQEVAKGMAELTVEFTARAGEDGKLFGSITTLHIAQQLKEMGYEVNRKKIKLTEPIKSLGNHTIELLLGAGVEAKVTIAVSKEELQKSEEAHDDFHESHEDTETMAEAIASQEKAAAKLAAKAAAKAAAASGESTAEAAAAEEPMPEPIVKSAEESEATEEPAAE